MDSYNGERVERIDSSIDGLKLFTRTNLAVTPKANIIIAHGLAEYSGRFKPLTSYLVEHHFNVFRYDQIGHGKSDGERGYMSSPDVLTDNLKIMVNRVKDNYFELPLYVLGHSMGGETVLLYASQYPGNVDGFVVTDPVSLMQDQERGMASMLPVQGDEHQTIPNAIGDGLDRDERVLNKYKNDPNVLHELTIGIYNNVIYKGAQYLRQNIHEIKDPVLFLQGLEDGLISYRDSLEAFKMIQSVDKELHVYPFLMHEILNEPSRKYEIYAEIDKWISKRIY